MKPVRRSGTRGAAPAASGCCIEIPNGPVFGVVTMDYLSRTGAVAHAQWPAREYQSVRDALDRAHMRAHQHDIRTYAIELEILRSGAAQ